MLKRLFNRGDILLIFISLFAMLIEIIPNLFGGYGYFIDEWYYIACAKHLAFGYVDHPSLAPLVLRGVLMTLGGSIIAIRLLPAIVGGAIVFLTGRMTRELGGGVFAQAVACLAMIAGPAFMVIFGFFSVNIFEMFFWTLCWYFLVKLLKTDDPRYWIWLGIAFGLGLESKHTIALLGIAICAGLLVTKSRKYFGCKEFWIGWAIAFLLILPNLIWQYFNGWPSLEFYRNATIYKNIATPPLKELLSQILFWNPVSSPVWIIGLAALLIRKDLQRYRPLGWMFAALFAIMVVSQSSRPDRIAGGYPVIFAAGGFAIEAFIIMMKRQAKFLKPAVITLLIIGGLVLAPIGLPILPPQTLAKWATTLAVVPKLEKGKNSQLPQWFGDRFDWNIFISTITKVYNDLPPEDKARAIIFAPSYGHAGVLEFYGPALGLPRVISNHNNYYLWGKGHADSDVLIAVGGSRWDWLHVYSQVDSVGVVPGTYAMSWRVNMPIFICRQPTTPMNAIWDRIKHYE